MTGIPRRGVLKGALLGAAIGWPIKISGKIPDIREVDGIEVHRIADPDNMTAVEKEHFIQIDWPKQVAAGEPFKATFSLPNHPMAKNHYIYSMRVYIDAELATYVTFAPVWQKPEVTFTFALGEGQRVDCVVQCTVHGMWGTTAPFYVKPSAGAAAPAASSTASEVAPPPAPVFAPSGTIPPPPAAAGSTGAALQ